MRTSTAGFIGGWSISMLAGGVWGVAFFSWGLPLPIPARVAVTALVLLALSAGSRAGLVAAGAFALGMGASSAVLLASAGQLFLEWWGLVWLVALAAGVALTGLALLGDSEANGFGGC